MPQFKIILKHSFSVLSVAIICFTIYGFQTFNTPQIFILSKSLGVLAAILFLLTLIPGIVKRLQITQLNQIANPLRFSRRTLGVSMFAAALAHYLFAVIFKIIKTNQTPEPKIFFVFGMLALFLSFWLALTSNRFAKHKLGKWWKRLHSLTYLIVWLIFLHTALIEISSLSLLVLIFAIVEIYSLIKVNFLDKRELQAI